MILVDTCTAGHRFREALAHVEKTHPHVGTKGTRVALPCAGASIDVVYKPYADALGTLCQRNAGGFSSRPSLRDHERTGDRI